MNWQHNNSIRRELLFGLFLAFLAAMALPGRSYAKLPPRPTPVPTSTPLPPPAIPGGFIGLSAGPAELPLWAQVQWLAGDGRWYDVDGWAGEADEEGGMRWYVGPSLLGVETPFRWRLYADASRQRLVYSIQFQLPRARSQSVIVTVPPAATAAP